LGASRGRERAKLRGIMRIDGMADPDTDEYRPLTALGALK
jgi:hypothetical protein